MHESTLYRPIVAGAGQEGFRLLRLVDGGGVQPFDLIGHLNGRIVAIEVKVDRRPGAVRWGDPMPDSWWSNRAHQLAWLRDVALEGGLSLIVWHHLPTGSNYLIHWQPHLDVMRMLNLPIQQVTTGQFERGFTGWMKMLEGSDPGIWGWESGTEQEKGLDRQVSGRGGELTDLNVRRCIP